ncbi:MAG: hypothetical protein QF467_00830 [SAR202 cluster bacterium]|jgi:hypothetical protein|nr:hypothetical protein [SAR202 cluster bacterium]
MAEAKPAEHLRVADVIEKYGACLELVPIDPNFHNISVGLYVKDDTCTVWTYSRKQGAQERVGTIRDQMVSLGGMAQVEGTHDQLRFSCGQFHIKPVKFLLSQAVGKAPDYAPPEGEMSIRDTKTKLTLKVTGRETGDRWVYQVSAEGEAPNVPMRLRMVVAGFVRYGEMEKVSDTEVSFSCGQRHDELLRVLLPYSRNISAVESMMEAEALRGQMTTGTLGFTPQ